MPSVFDQLQTAQGVEEIDTEGCVQLLLSIATELVRQWLASVFQPRASHRNAKHITAHPCKQSVLP